MEKLLSYYTNENTFSKANREYLASFKDDEKVFTLDDWNKDLRTLVVNYIGLYARKTCSLFALYNGINELINPYSCEKFEDILQSTMLRTYEMIEKGCTDKNCTFEPNQIPANLLGKTTIKAMNHVLRKTFRIHDWLNEEIENQIIEQETKTEYARINGMNETFERFDYKQIKELKELINVTGPLTPKQKMLRMRNKERIEKLGKQTKLNISSYIGLTSKKQILEDYRYYLMQVNEDYYEIVKELKELKSLKQTASKKYIKLLEEKERMEGLQ